MCQDADMPDSSFTYEILGRAASSAIASMSTSALALLSGLAYGIYKLILSYRREGWPGVRAHFVKDAMHGLIFGICWWALLYSYHLFYKVPSEIRAQAAAAHAPLPPKLTVPEKIAYLRTVSRHLPPETPVWNDKSPEPKSLSALFTQDFPTTMKLSDDAIGIQWKDNGGILHIKRQLYLDFSNKQKFVGFYIPSSEPPDVTRTVDACLEVAKGDAIQMVINEMSKNTPMLAFTKGGPTSMGQLTFTKKALIYHDDILSPSQRAPIVKAFAVKHYHVQFMGPDYFARRTRTWQHQHGIQAQATR